MLQLVWSVGMDTSSGMSRQTDTFINADSPQSQTQTTITSSDIPTTSFTPPGLKVGASTLASGPSSSKQIGRVPAVGSGPGAATINTENFSSETPSATTTSNAETPSASGSRLPSETVNNASPTANIPKQSGEGGETSAAGSGSGILSATNSPVFSIPGPSDSSSVQLGTGFTSQTITKPQETEAFPTPTINTSVQNTQGGTLHSPSTVSALSSATFTETSGPQSPLEATTSLKASQAGAAATSSASTGKGDNIALANAFNSKFGSLTPDSQCNPNDEKQAHACVNNMFAQCNTAGKYTMTACPEGQQCFALPLPESSTGVSVQCDTPSDAKKKLQPEASNAGSGQSAGNSPTAQPSQNSAPPGPVTSTTVSSSPVVQPSSLQTESRNPATQASGPAAQPTDPVVQPSRPATQPEGQSQAASGKSTGLPRDGPQPTTLATETRSKTPPDTTSAVPQPQPPLQSPKTSSRLAATSTTDAPLTLSFPPTSSSQQSVGATQQPIPVPPGQSQAPDPDAQRSSPAPAAVPSSPADSPTAPSPDPNPEAAKTSASGPDITIIPLNNERVVTVTETVTKTTMARN
ncbi:MAG: hypothetical protein Q9190_004752 [Brigantiaea leucoxantha]